MLPSVEPGAVVAPPEGSKLVAEAPFGSVRPLLRWHDEDDLVQHANDTERGLGASIRGRDGEALERIGHRIQADTAWIDEVHQNSPHQAYGGRRRSRIGCGNSVHGLTEATDRLSVTSDLMAEV